ncbi:MAG: alpha/beta hydrolase [Chloroflexi bacterium]|nr:alpha/beta hydrolase [Chloroflexota bacterium]
MATTTVTSKFVHVNGLKLRYLEWGSATATPFIMLHGLRGNASEWEPIARQFADRYRCIALDQRGRGESDWSPNAEYFTNAYVSDLEQVVEQLGLSQFVLMGHSMGGGNTLVYTARHPERVIAAILVDAGARPPGMAAGTGGARIAREMENAPAAFATWEQARAHIFMERPLMSQEATDIRTRSIIRELPNGKLGWRYDMEGIGRARQNTSTGPAIDSWALAQGLARPTLVLRGDVSDSLSAEAAQAMAGANPNIRWVEVPRADHYVHEDNAPFVNAQIEKFLASLK